MPLCLAISIFALASLLSFPALAAEPQQVEGKVASVTVTVDGGFTFQLVGERPICASGKTPVTQGGLVEDTLLRNRNLLTHEWAMELLLEAKREGRMVRVHSEPARNRRSSYCRILALTLL